MPGPLAGLRVLEVSSFVAAPLGGMTLAQLGADVIRIDPIGGAADRRRWPVADGTSLYWAGLNKGKRSIEVDLRSPEGRKVVCRLVGALPSRAGVFLTNSVGQPWLEYEALLEHCPDLVHVHVRGRDDGSPAVDYTVNAEMGFPLVTGPAGHAEPVNHVLPAWDIACGLFTAIGVLAADRERRSSGTGRKITVALHDVALAMAGNLGYLAEAQLSAEPRRRIGNYLYGGFARDFVTRDGVRFMVVALTARHWRDLLKVTGTDNVVRSMQDTLGVDFGDEDVRFDYREVLAGLLSRWFLAADADAVAEELGSTSIIWSQYRTFHEVVARLQTPGLESPLVRTVTQPGVGELLVASTPLGFDGAFPTPKAAPVLGGDTNPVLQELLGVSEREVARMAREGIVRIAS